MHLNNELQHYKPISEVLSTCTVWAKSGKQFVSNVFLDTHRPRVNLKDVRPALHAEHTSMKICHTAVDKY